MERPGIGVNRQGKAVAGVGGKPARNSGTEARPLLDEPGRRSQGQDVRGKGDLQTTEAGGKGGLAANKIREAGDQVARPGGLGRAFAMLQEHAARNDTPRS